MSTPPRRKVARRSPEERIAQIAAASRALALEQGLAALTLRAIAARTGVTPALIAHYEPNMDALVAATFRAIVSAEIDDIAVLLGDLPSSTARIRGLIDTLLDGTRDAVTVVWVEAWAIGRRNDALAQAVRAEMDAWQAVVEDIVECGVAGGEFEAVDAATTAWQLLGMIDGLNAQALVRWKQTGERASLIHRAVEGMLGLARGSLDRGRSDEEG